MDWDNRSDSKYIAEGAILSAVAAALGLLGIYIPPLSVLTSLVWLVPLIIVTMRWGLKRGAMAVMITGVLVGLLSTPVEAILLLVEYGALALVYGHSFRKMLPLKKTLFRGVVAAVVGSLLMILISMGILGIEPADISKQMAQASQATVSLYESTGLLDQFEAQGIDRATVIAMTEQVAKVMVTIIPSILVVMAIITAVISLLISRSVLAKLKIKVPDKLPPFRMWRLDFRFVYGFIFGLVLFLLGDYLNQSLVTALGTNLLVALGFVFLLQGLSVLVYMAKNFKMSTFLKIMFGVLAVLYFQVVFFLLIFIGLFDLFFDYRGRLQKKGDNNESNSK